MCLHVQKLRNVTGVISEKDALKSIDLKVVFLFGGSLTLAKALDTTGAGDSFFAGVCMGLTYGKTLREACGIGTRLASTVICTSENICPRFMPEEFGLER